MLSQNAIIARVVSFNGARFHFDRLNQLIRFCFIVAIDTV